MTNDPTLDFDEGKLIAIVAPDKAEALLAAMRAHALGREAAIIGRFVTEHRGLVTARAGELLPRIY